MPRKRPSDASTYDSDNGFVANDNDDDDRPKSKRVKTSQKANAPAKGRNGKGGSKVKEVAGGGAVDGNGDAFWEVCFYPSFSASFASSFLVGKGSGDGRMGDSG